MDLDVGTLRGEGPVMLSEARRGVKAKCLCSGGESLWPSAAGCGELLSMVFLRLVPDPVPWTPGRRIYLFVSLSLIVDTTYTLPSAYEDNLLSPPTGHQLARHGCQFAVGTWLLLHDIASHTS